MNLHFNSIHSPNCTTETSLQKIDSNFIGNFKQYDKKTLFPPNGNCVQNNNQEYYQELFYKRKFTPFIGKQVKSTDDFLNENILPGYENDHSKMIPRKKLIFDISSMDYNEKYFIKHKCDNFNFNELSKYEEQILLNDQTMPEIEPLLTDEKIPKLKANSNYEIKCEDEHSIIPFMNFDLKTKDLPFKRAELPLKNNDELVVDSPCDLDILTQNMFIHKEINSSTSNNNTIADHISQSESYFDSFIQKMKVIILKFDCKQTLTSEPYSQEWLDDLNISKKNFDEHIQENNVFFSHFESSNLNYENLENPNNIQVAVKGNITEEFSPIISKNQKNEANFLFSNSKQIREMIETIQKDYSEKEIPVENIPNIVFINTAFFSNEDIIQFGNFFNNLKFIGVEFKKQFLFTINDKIANIIIIDEDFAAMQSDIAEILSIFSQIIITTIKPPCICLPKRIKWRYITSHSQIAAAILPFLVEENSTASNNSKENNKPL